MNKKIILIIVTLALGLNAFSQTYTLTISGGGFEFEKWMNITTEVNGGGVQVWGQGNETLGNGSGYITDVSIDLSSYCGQTLYLNAYDAYDDSWDGSVYDFRVSGGATVLNNSGSSPDDGANVDAGSGWEHPVDIETSESFIVDGPSCCESNPGTLSK